MSFHINSELKLKIAEKAKKEIKTYLEQNHYSWQDNLNIELNIVISKSDDGKLLYGMVIRRKSHS